MTPCSKSCTRTKPRFVGGTPSSISSMLVHCGRKRSDKVETFRFSLCIVGGSSVWFRNLPVSPSGNIYPLPKLRPIPLTRCSSTSYAMSRVNARRSRGDSLPAIGSDLGVSRQAVQQWLSGATQPSRTALKLAEQLCRAPLELAPGLPAGRWASVEPS